MLTERLDPDFDLIDPPACFVPWDLETNKPRIVVDFSGNFLEGVWLS